MGAAQSFDQILKEKMEAGNEASSAFEAAPVTAETHSNTIAFESFFTRLSSTLDSFVTEIPTAQVLKTAYASVKKAPTQEPAKKAARPERTKIRSQLSAVEVLALEVFIKYGAFELAKSDLLGESVIKKTYRRLAVELHPDTNKQAQGAAFRQLNEAYVVLSKMLKA